MARFPELEIEGKVNLEGRSDNSMLREVWRLVVAVVSSG